MKQSMQLGDYLVLYFPKGAVHRDDAFYWVVVVSGDEQIATLEFVNSPEPTNTFEDEMSPEDFFALTYGGAVENNLFEYEQYEVLPANSPRFLTHIGSSPSAAVKRCLIDQGEKLDKLAKDCRELSTKLNAVHPKGTDTTADVLPGLDV